jgi:DNA sulfur modification protein DndD
MDTPFGRIDPSHRKTTLEYLSKSANQLILLVHEGEIDRQKDLLPIASKIGNQYEITKVNSKYSRIDIYHG